MLLRSTNDKPLEVMNDFLVNGRYIVCKYRVFVKRLKDRLNLIRRILYPCCGLDICWYSCVFPSRYRATRESDVTGKNQHACESHVSCDKFLR